MTNATLNQTEVKFLPPEEVGEELAGWWILELEPEAAGTQSVPTIPRNRRKRW
ncbi:hypothetical protein [Bradyrhizobium diazoefficiens]|uniref:Uncharacterized protein n=1 Tax=Bradyrhizobium diazoefficiens TaxID=1355477 RepID=A0A809ZC38_9BRAD|nr:hypothetical protein XF1B_47360 [Bradyrhizobium diazoefficiens]BCE48320.1 hypothetical protein XF4B_46690 [Bradyrhizobium diazoefficiens]BCE91836.1 hypothetical protein XF10B_46340 [Bradyrhizobium diazoefficiens]BCF26764.1 hypothetical protein XF14B_47160 [Bradyrhizobium diazoefficiens]